MLFAILRQLWLRKALRKPAQRQPRTILRFDPLEDRSTPSVYRWIGGQNTSWTNMTNWQGQIAGTNQWGAVPVSYPGQGGNTDDEVYFDGSAVKDCSPNLTGSLFLKSFKIFDHYNRIVTINPGARVRVSHVDPGSGVADGQLFVQSGTLEVLGTASVELGDCNGLWTGGSINNNQQPNRPDNSPGILVVGGNAQLDIQQDATDLGVNLVIGQQSTTTESVVNISQMNQNLRLCLGASITVQVDGVLNLAQNSDSATKGGIVMAPESAASQITNYGILYRAVDRKDGDAPQYLTVEPSVTNATGLFKMAQKASIEFTNGFTNSGGTVDLKSSNITIPAGKEFFQSDGTILLRDDGSMSKCLFDANVEIDGGVLQVGENLTPDDNSATDFVEMDVSGDLTLGAESQTYLSLAVDMDSVCDSIHVGGLAEINGGLVSITLVDNPNTPANRGQPAVGRQWDLLVGSTVGTWTSSEIRGTTYCFSYARDGRHYIPRLDATVDADGFRIWFEEVPQG